MTLCSVWWHACLLCSSPARQPRLDSTAGQWLHLIFNQWSTHRHQHCGLPSYSRRQRRWSFASQLRWPTAIFCTGWQSALSELWRFVPVCGAVIVCQLLIVREDVSHVWWRIFLSLSSHKYRNDVRKTTLPLSKSNWPEKTQWCH